MIAVAPSGLDYLRRLTQGSQSLALGLTLTAALQLVESRRSESARSKGRRNRNRVSRQVASGVQVELCLLCLPPGFPAVPHHFNLSPVGSCPSQNRACAINAHGSPDNHSGSFFFRPDAEQFCGHRFPASVCGRCFPTLLDHLSPPSLQRHYPPSLVL